MLQPTLVINEIFYSIQGESTHAGLPCVFVRLTGCHLRCAYCDTEYAFKEGGRQTIEQIIERVDALGRGCSLVEVTGGEPLLQPNVHELMTRLCDAGKTVLVETSGACDISVCDDRVARVLDFKTPGSGEADRNLWSNVQHLTPRDEVKFVLTGRADYDWAVTQIVEHRLAQRAGAVLLSAAAAMAPTLEIAGAAGLSVTDLATWMLEDKRLPKNVRFQTQLHKLIWDPMARGV